MPTTAFFRHLISVVLLASALFLVACGSDDNTPPDEEEPPPALPDQDPSGIYTSGTATIDGVDYTDFQAIVHEGRIMAFSPSAHTLFDGTFDTITSDEYTATVDIYEGGLKTEPAIAFTGTISNETQITGLASGTGVANASFSLDFDSQYSRGATFARAEAQGLYKWEGDAYYYLGDGLRFIFDISLDGSNFGGSNTCNYIDGVIIPNETVNIYSISFNITDISDCNMISDGHTGFMTIVDGDATDNKLLFAISNGTYSTFGILPRPIP